MRGGRENVGPSMSAMAAEASMHRKTWAAVPASAEGIGSKHHLHFATVNGVGGGGCTSQKTPRSCLSLAQSVTMVERMPEGMLSVRMTMAAWAR
jgi:hypothetical protein